MGNSWKPNDPYQQIIDIKARLDAIERTEQMSNTSLSVTASPGSQAGRKGFMILAADGKTELVRLGATDTDASPAAAQGLTGLSVKDAGGGIRALFGQTSSTPTYGMRTFDNAGVKRFDAGQLDASTYGAAAYDASGGKIWDTTGLIKTLSIAGSLEYTTATIQSMPALATTAVGNSSFSFTTPASRTVNVLLLATVNAQVQSNNAGAFSQNCYFQVSGQTRSARGMIPFLTNAGGFGPQCTVTLFQVLTGLSGGTYTGNWWFINPFNGAINVDIGDITVYAFQLGS